MGPSAPPAPASTRSATSSPGPALAHKASEEGIIAVEDSAGLQTHPLAHVDIPRATFCTPNVGSFGLTEAQAREEGYDVVVGKVKYGAVGGGIVYGDPGGLVKVVGERKYGELLGRTHRRLARHRADPGARQRARAGGRLFRGGPHRPRPPHALRGGDGSRTRGGRLVDPRLKTQLPARGRAREPPPGSGPRAFTLCS